jgi:hypothetical protein
VAINLGCKAKALTLIPNYYFKQACWLCLSVCLRERERERERESGGGGSTFLGFKTNKNTSKQLGTGYTKK